MSLVRTAGLDPCMHVALVALRMPSSLACDFLFTNHVSHHTEGCGWAGMGLILSVGSACTVSHTLLSQYLLKDREEGTFSPIVSCESPRKGTS